MEIKPATAQVYRPAVDYETLLRLGRDLLVALGEDPEREGLVETPRRFASLWREFVEYEPGNTDTTFEAVTTDQMVIVKGIRVWSVCEHHLLPFWCDISIGYITAGKVLGLSKFARVAHQKAHRPQLQERLLQEIADEIGTLTESRDIAVIGRGVHLCMVMRGIKTSGEMVTSIMRGRFRETDARAEFLALA